MASIGLPFIACQYTCVSLEGDLSTLVATQIKSDTDCLSDCIQLNVVRASGFAFASFSRGGSCLCSRSSLQVAPSVTCLSVDIQCNFLTQQCDDQQIRFFQAPISNGIPNVTIALQAVVVNFGLGTIEVSAKSNYPPLYSFDFGDGTYVPYSNISKQIHMYLTPGVKQLAVGVKSNASGETWHQRSVLVYSRIRAVELMCGPNFKAIPSVPSKCYFRIGSGTNMSIILKQSYNGVQDNVFPMSFTDVDVSTKVFGAGMDYQAQRRCTYALNDGFYVLPDLTFDESGVLSALRMTVAKPGVIKLCILRPECGSPLVYCHINRKCVNGRVACQPNITCSVNCNITATSYPELLNYIRIIQDAYVSFNKSGDVILQLSGANMLVRPGDMLGVAFLNSSGPCLIDVTSDSQRPYYAYAKLITELHPNFVIPVRYLSKPSGRLMLSVFLHKRVSVVLPQERKSPGNVLISAEIVNLLGSLKYEEALPVELVLQELSIDSIRNRTVGGYSLGDWLRITPKLKVGQNATFHYFISHTLTNFSASGVPYVDYLAEFVGVYQVQVVATNRVSMVNTTVEVVFLAPVKGLQLLVDRSVLSINEDMNIAFRIIGGNYVTLEIDFGDGSLAEKNLIEDARVLSDVRGEQYAWFNITRRFSTCQFSKITAKAYNSLTTMEEIAVLTKSVVYGVICQLSGLVISSNPTAGSDGIVYSSVNISIGLVIRLALGSGVMYNISFGDGRREVVSQVHLVKPEVIIRSVQYDREGQYQVVAVAYTPFQRVTSNAVNVTVLKCTAPPVELSGSSERDNPVEITRGIDFEVFASYRFESKECEALVGADMSFTSWQLRNTSSKVVYDEVAMPGRRLTSSYTIPRLKYQVGSYELVVGMKWKNLEFAYSNYVKIIPSPLVALISGGARQSLGFMVRVRDPVTGNVTRTVYNFSIDASASYDPDQGKDSASSMSFVWHCRLISNSSIVSVSRTVRANRNNTLFEGTHCLSQEWTSLVQHVMFAPRRGRVTLNSEMFLENVEYAFRVTASIGSRWSVASQQIYFSTGDPPPVTLNCTSNCDEKINFQERLILEYKCPICPADSAFDAKWTLFEEDGSVSPIMQLGTASRTGWNRANLVINENALKMMSNYTLALAISFAGELSRTELQYALSTSDIPSGGYCSIGPTSGSAFTKFRVFCMDWRNRHPPTRYVFQYDLGMAEAQGALLSSTSGAKSYPLWYSGLSPNNQADSLPIGNPKLNYTIKMKIKIINKFGAYCDYDQVTVQVFPPSEDEISARKNDSAPDPKTATATQMGSYVTTLMSVLSSQTDALDQASSNVPVDPSTGMVDSYAQQQKADREAVQREALAKEKAKLIDNLMSTEVRKPADIKIICGAMDSLSSSPLDMDSADQGKMLDKLLMLSDAALSSDTGHAERERNLLPDILKVADNLLKATLEQGKKIADMSQETGSTAAPMTTQSTVTDKPTAASKLKEIASHKSKVRTTERVIENVRKAFHMSLVVGAAPTTAETDTMKISASKVDAQNVTNSSFSGFVLPDMKLFNDSVSSLPILVNMHSFKTNPYAWDLDNAQTCGSEITALSFSADGNEVSVKDTPKPIVINIQNKPSALTGRNISFYLPLELQMEAVQIDDVKSSMLISFKFLDSVPGNFSLCVFIQYGISPTKLNHDVLLNISKGEGIRLSKNVAQVNVTSGSQNVTIKSTKWRSSNVRLIDNASIILWDFDEFTYGNSTSRKLFFGMYYDGPLPPMQLVSNPYTFDVLYFSRGWNVSMQTFTPSCRWWDERNDRFSTDGCEVDVTATNFTVTVCACNHLTAFGGFYVKPNPLPTPSLALLKEGYVLFVTIGAILVLYILGLIVCRRLDKNDISKIGVCPLADNRPEDVYVYEMTVHTGSRRHSGTTSKVFFNLAGEDGETGARHLADPKRKTFQRASADVFVFTTSRSLGDLTYLRIWHDNSGTGWYLRNVDVVDLQTDEKATFLASRWLAVEKGDGMVECLLPVATSTELTDFNYLFNAKSRRDLSDGHLWFSVYARPPRSPFTRCQRLSVAVSILLCSMTASAMFYGAIPPADAQKENKIGNFTFNLAQVYVAVISTCITLPVNVILVLIFRSIRPKRLSNDQQLKATQVRSNSRRSVPRPDRNKDSDEVVVNIMPVAAKAKAKKKKRKIYLPCYFLYVGWAICVLAIIGCSFVIIWYGMAFGNNKSLQWLTTISISLVKDVLLIQPVKVFILALFIALVVKKLDEEEPSEVEKQAKSLARDEEWMHRDESSAGTIFDRTDTFSQPPDMAKLDIARELRFKEMKMAAISRELMFYVFFAFITLMIAYFTRDMQAYHQNRDVEEMFCLRKRSDSTNCTALIRHDYYQMLSYDDFWGWADGVLLTRLYPDPWYNIPGGPPRVNSFPGKIFVNDLGSKIVNGVRLRQVRVKDSSCRIASQAKEYVKIDCADSYNAFDEENRDFDLSWDRLSESKQPLSQKSKPWRFQTWSVLDAYPVLAELNTYYGGGYVVEIFPRWNNSAILQELKEQRWLDRHSRALIIEFALFNPASNYFSSVTLVLEFPPSGGVIPWHSILTFKLYRYTSGSALFTIACELAFIACILAFFVRETRLAYRTGLSYFGKFWNMVECAILLLAVMAVVFYFYRDKLARDLLQRLPAKKPNVFINFQFAAYWDLFLTYLVALIVFFVVLKFMKLLRFNRRIAMLSNTLKAAWYPLGMFSIVLFIFLAAMVCFATTIFGKELYEYRDVSVTVSSIVGLLLGKFSFHQFGQAHREFGPIFFFGFNIMINWVLMNMLISILNDVFAVVKDDTHKMANEYEMLDYMMNNVKALFGFSQKPAPPQKGEVEKLEKNWEELVKRRSLFKHAETSEDVDAEQGLSSDDQLALEKPLDVYDDGLTGLKQSSYMKELHFDFDGKLGANCDDIPPDEVNLMVSRFVKCINVLFFDDDQVARKMNEVVSNEIQKCPDLN